MDAAVPDLPIVVVRDSAIDALCHGAILAGVGVVSLHGVWQRPDRCGPLAEEGVHLSRAGARSFRFVQARRDRAGYRADNGFHVARHYPRGWTKSGKEFPEKKKQEAKPAPAAQKTLEIRGDTAAIFRKENGGAGLRASRATGQKTRQKTRPAVPEKEIPLKKYPGVHLGYTFSEVV